MTPLSLSGVSVGRECAAKGCETTFIPKRPHALYCSDACRARAYKPRRNQRTQEPRARVLRNDSPRISYHKAVKALEMAGEVSAVRVLFDVLPPRQRDRLTV